MAGFFQKAGQWPRYFARNLRFQKFKWFSGKDAGREFLNIYDRCKYFTLTPGERMFALYLATRYIAQRNIPGDIVECGVYKGGSMMLSALTLEQLNDRRRSFYLYDTYEGMTRPTEKDVSLKNSSALKKWQNLKTDNGSAWCLSGLDEVRANMHSTGYPQDKLVFVQGKVEDTLPKTVPEKIALLRLDTDWYESTYHELCHLFPRLVPQGVLIIDDYGHWQGAREAVDTYFRENNVSMLLNRIDYSGRIGVKL